MQDWGEDLQADVILGHFACKRVPVGDDHAWLEKGKYTCLSPPFQKSYQGLS